MKKSIELYLEILELKGENKKLKEEIEKIHTLRKLIKEFFIKE
jgi:hypothetical protein